MRILHISDLHLGLPWSALPFSSWFSKRLVGGANLLLGRGRSYDEANEKVAHLDAFRRAQAIDVVLCTGDYTAFGTRPELENAHAAVASLFEAPLGFAGIPGNHDLYTPDVLKEGRFDEIFGGTMTSDLPELCVDGPWPYVRLLGDDVAVVAVNSARPRPLWSSSGRVPDAQVEGLHTALADARVRTRFVFVMTHYASCLEGGLPDTKRHGLENTSAFLAACEGIERGATLCGHVHRRFTVPAGEPLSGCAGLRLPLSLFCAGSTTKAGREGLWIFDVEPDGVRATPGHWDGKGYAIENAERVSVSRPASTASP